MTSPLEQVPDRWTVREAIGKNLRELRHLRRLERLAKDIDRERDNIDRVTTDRAQYRVDSEGRADG